MTNTRRETSCAATLASWPTWNGEIEPNSRYELSYIIESTRKYNDLYEITARRITNPIYARDVLLIRSKPVNRHKLRASFTGGRSTYRLEQAMQEH